MNIVCFCTLSTGLLQIDHAIRQGVKIDKIIGLNPEMVKDSEKISGYVDISNFCIKNKIDYSLIDEYSLKNITPETLIDKNSLIWVNAWQRLIPKSYIDYSDIGVIGAHGSCDGITKGRGRSPQNWAILIGAKKFEISLFRIQEGIDNGAVITTESFDLEPSDTILISYFKSGIACAEGMKKIYMNRELIENAKVQTENPAYFPKRTPEDSFIDWSMSSEDIYNQIRALSEPYPNARTKLDDQTLYINKSSKLDYKNAGAPGEIVYIFPSREMIVACGDGALLLQDFKFDSNISDDILGVGKVFKSYDMSKIVNNILIRFNEEFPGKELNNSLINFWKSRGYIL